MVKNVRTTSVAFSGGGAVCEAASIFSSALSCTSVYFHISVQSWSRSLAGHNTQLTLTAPSNLRQKNNWWFKEDLIVLNIFYILIWILKSISTIKSYMENILDVVTIISMSQCSVSTMTITGTVFFLITVQPVFPGLHERRLLLDLMSEYNKLERPVYNETDPVILTFGLTLQQIIDVASHVISFSKLWNVKTR